MSQTLTPTCLRGKVVATSDVTLRGNQAGKRQPASCGLCHFWVYSFVSWHHVDANDWGRFDLIAAPTYVELAKPGDALWLSITLLKRARCNAFC